VELGPSQEHGGVRVEIVLPDRLLTGPPAPPEHGRAEGQVPDLPRTARVMPGPEPGLGDEVVPPRSAAAPGHGEARARGHGQRPDPEPEAAPADDAGAGEAR
jgi:hypothetical protein